MFGWTYLSYHWACVEYSRAYSPPRARSSSWTPSSTIFPSLKTTILSASDATLIRWVTMMTVQFLAMARYFLEDLRFS